MKGIILRQETGVRTNMRQIPRMKQQKIQGGKYSNGVYTLSIPLLFMTLTCTRKYKVDQRTRRERLAIRTRAWKQQIPLLTEAYLHWKHSSALPALTDEAASPFSVQCVNFFGAFYSSCARYY